MSESALALRQFARFAVIGVLSNAFFYALYILLTQQGLPPMKAMTLTYGLAVLQTFAFNRRWTFAHSGKVGWSLMRYFASYAIGYAVNVAMLTVLVDHAGLPHQAVQGLAIVSIAVLTFLLQKYWVFPAQRGRLR